MKKTVYLSGPITGLPQNNFKEFALAQEKVEALGYNVLNPHEFFEHKDTKNWQHHDFMRVCIAKMMKADLIITLPGWEKSKGAVIEVKIARELLIEVTSYVLIFKPKTANAA